MVNQYVNNRVCLVFKTLLCTLIIALLMVVPVFANGFVTDGANIFSDPNGLDQKMSELTEMLGYPVYIVTSRQAYSTDALSAADYLLMERVGANNNGVMLAINMASRDVTFTSSGPDLQSDNLSDDDIDIIYEAVRNKLTSGDYDGAALVYYEKVRRVLAGNYLSFFDMIIAGIVSLLGVGGYSASQYAKYNPRAKRKVFALYQNARVNIAGGGDRLIDTREIVTTIPKVSNKSSGFGSGGGRSHSTGGGSFRGRSGKF